MGSLAARNETAQLGVVPDLCPLSDRSLADHCADRLAGAGDDAEASDPRGHVVAGWSQEVVDTFVGAAGRGLASGQDRAITSPHGRPECHHRARQSPPCSKLDESRRDV